MFLEILEVSNNNSSPDEATLRRRNSYLSLRLKFSLPVLLKCFLIFAWFEPHVSYILVSYIKTYIITYVMKSHALGWDNEQKFSSRGTGNLVATIIYSNGYLMISCWIISSNTWWRFSATNTKYTQQNPSWVTQMNVSSTHLESKRALCQSENKVDVSFKVFYIAKL